MGTAEIEVIFVRIFKKVQPQVEIYYKYMDKWLDGRQRLIKSCLEIADRIDLHGRNANIAKTTGAGVGALGAGIALAGLLFPPAALVGLGVGLAGGFTGVGASITKGLIKKSKMGEVEKLVKEDQETYAKIKEAIDLVAEAASEVRHELGDAMPELTKEEIIGACLAGKVVLTGVKTLGFARNLAKVIIAGNLAAGAGGGVRVAFAAGQALKGLGRMVGKGLLVVAIPLTIVDLWSSISDLVNSSSESKELRQYIVKMQGEYEEMNNTYTEIKKMGTKIA